MSARAGADVCLLLEGTYPYVLGGVSSWVHHLVTHMPEIDFGIVHLCPQADYYGTEFAYPVPDNVVWVEQLELLQPAPARGRRHRRRQHAERLWGALGALRAGDPEPIEAVFEDAFDLWADSPGTDGVLRSDCSWQTLLASYRAEAADESFLNFFWTWMFAYEPLLNVLLYPVPEAGMYHTVSTGYAGLLAAIAARAHRRPMVLTEHGIYTKERRIEIYSATWIQDRDPEELLVDHEAPYFRQFWSEHFEAISTLCYRSAERIYTLYGGNREAQIADGADPDKIEIVPNGVDLRRFEAARQRHLLRLASEDRGPFTVAFVGRVAPIKDVRTFLAAMRLVAKVVPDLRVRVLGPMEEDPDYAAQCRVFAQELGLGANVRFEGRVDVAEELPEVDVLVLTSISEAQPLVILEAGAMEVPVVATDVGSCRELLEGRTPEDRSLGIGGLLTPIASPGATAKAVMELYSDPDMRRALGRNLRRRVERYYDERAMVAAYREVYGQGLAAGAL